MARPVPENSRLARFLLLASICVVVASLYLAQEVLIPLALAVLVSFLLSPLASRVETLMGRTASVLVVVLLGLGVVVVIGWVVKDQFVQIAEQLPNYREDIRQKFDSFRNSTGPLKKSIAEIQKIATTQPTSLPAAATEGLNGDKPMPQWTAQHPLPTRLFPASSPIQEAGSWMKTVMSPLVTAGLVIVFIIFMLIDREDLRDRLIRLSGHGRLNVTTQALDEASSRISRYLLAQGMVNAGYGICVAGGLWCVGHFWGGSEGGFPSVLLWGLLCGVLRFIPYIGIWIAAAFPILLSFALFKGSGVFIGTICLFGVLELAVGQFIEPYLYGSSTGLSPLAVLVAAVFWTWLWGLAGLLLSTPLTVCLVVIGKHAPQLRFLDILLGDEPVLEPPVRLYQRLIALDAEEAADVARQYLKDHPLEEVYERVLLPALSMAEHDQHHGHVDEEHRRFIYDSMRQLIDELGDEAQVKEVRNDAAAIEQAAKDVSASRLDTLSRRIPEGSQISVLCLPASDEADEISGLMLSQLLERRGYITSTAPVAALASEMMESVEEKKASIVCVCAMPPAAVAHARYLCKRLHARFQEMKMVVGLWTSTADREKAKARLTCAQSVALCHTLAEAIEQIEQLVHPVLVAATSNGNLNTAQP